MCGRFVAAADLEAVAAYFETPMPGFELPRSYNVAPTDDIAAVVCQRDGHDQGGDGLRRLDVFRWGLVPSWAKDRRIGARMINARAETAATKSAFRSAFRHRRCIVPADGFYEWPAAAPDAQAPGGAAATGGRPGADVRPANGGPGGGAARGAAKPMPRYIYRADGEPLGMAGLWERWRPPGGRGGDAAGGGRRGADGPEDGGGDAGATEDGGRDVGTGGGDGPLSGHEMALHSVAVLTTAANEFMTPIHDRMPVLLPRSAWDEWLDPRNHDTDGLAALCVPAAEGTLRSHAVGRAVGNVRNNDASLIEPAAPDTLF